jgi:hypothetical protein
LWLLKLLVMLMMWKLGLGLVLLSWFVAVCVTSRRLLMLLLLLNVLGYASA